MADPLPPVLALDIGSTKVEAMIARFASSRAGDPRIEVLGWSDVPTRGLRKGVVIHLEETARAIRDAANQAWHLAGVEVVEAVVSVSGGHIRGVNSRGVTPVRGDDGEVSQADVDRAIEAAAAISLPMEREILHILPQEFILDGAPGIRDPVGMRATRLEVEAHIVTGAVASAQNLIAAVNRAGLAVDDILLEPLAASNAVLAEDEKELGVILLNLGGGTTDLAVFHQGALWQTEVLPLGSEYVTKDISEVLRTPLADAELLKRKWGVAKAALVAPGETVEIPSVGGRAARPLERAVLAEIIEARLQEIFLLSQRAIARGGLEKHASAGVVLTGGGATIPGILDAAEEVLQCPVRLGIPSGLGGLAENALGPAHATVAGLARHALSRQAEGTAAHEEDLGEGAPVFEKVYERMKRWFKD